MIVINDKVYCTIPELVAEYPIGKSTIYRWVEKSRVDILDINVFCRAVLGNRISSKDLHRTVYIELESFERNLKVTSDIRSENILRMIKEAQLK